MKISIIIPTKNRSEHIENCLRSITSADKNYDEIIIVDGSTDSNEQNKTELIVNTFGGKYYFEPKTGVSVARNTGITESSGDILVFADDDFIVDMNWINNLIVNYKDPDVVGCTGRMLSYRDDDASKLYEKSMSFDRGNKKRIFSKKDISILNLLSTITKIGNKRLLDKTPVPWGVGYGFYSFRRNVFNQIGFFDINLGRGTPAIGGEDPDLLYRILKAGKIIIYEPKAIIYHNHRQNFADIFKDAYNSGISMHAVIEKYILKKDLYISCCFLGYFCLLISALIKASFGNDKTFKKMIKLELKGYMNGK